jgi:hypothetical protein
MACNESHRVTQNEISDLIRDLNFSKSKGEILSSRLQQWNLLKENVNISIYRSKDKKFTPFFAMKDNPVPCLNINGLMKDLSINYSPEEWILFIDSSSVSLKAMLLHVDNELPSVPIGYAVHLESYENLKLLFEVIKCGDFQWQICDDLKVTALLLGMQLRYTKYCCLSCKWDSRAPAFHCTKSDWPTRKTL